MPTTTEKADVYKVITDRITQQIEKGVVPWRRPWTSLGAPKNLVSKKAYRGINTFLLMAGAYNSPWWLTFKQAKDLGGRVNAGEKGWPVVFWRKLSKSEDDDNGETKVKKFMFLRYYTVFNVDQTSGLEAKIPALAPVRESNPIEACERIVSAMPSKPDIRHGGDRACYSLLFDHIQMPVRQSFESDQAYYQTLFHELIHSTGAEKRLARFKGDATQGMFGSESYSQEELVAEMGAAFLCGASGIENDTQNTAAYLSTWLERLKSDTKLIVMAGAQAQKAADFIQGVKWEEKEKDEESEG